MLTNRELSDKLDIPIGMIRRNTKEFLGEDLKATRRSGYKREFSNNDAFFVFLGGHLVSNLGFSFEGARKILEMLKPWLLSTGYVPDIPNYAVRNGPDSIMKRNIVISIFPNLSSSKDRIKWENRGIQKIDRALFRVRGFTGRSRSQRHNGETDPIGRPFILIHDKEIVYDFTVDYPDLEIRYVKEMRKRIIHYTSLLQRKDLYLWAALNSFIQSVFGRDRRIEWQKAWRRLVKENSGKK